MKKLLISKRFLLRLFFLLALLSIFIACAPEVKVPKKGFAPKPCMECHKEMRSELTKQHVHDPMSKHDCEACHLRHGRLAVKTFVEREASLRLRLSVIDLHSDEDPIPGNVTIVR